LKYLVTGSSGFIGFHLCKRLCELGFEVHGVDNHNDYYDVDLKESRESFLSDFKNFSFFKLDLNDKAKIDSLFKNNCYEKVIHLAAQAGVRYSLTNPLTYGESNLSGFLNILEACRTYCPKNFIFASSSSVYGNTNKFPLNESDPTDMPASLYAATKKSNELLAYSYSSLYKLPSIGLRFFTVYGPYGRPDMAYYSFTKSIINNQPIKVFNQGKMYRDFTYIDDIIDGIFSILDMDIRDSRDNSFFEIYNIGSGRPINLSDFIEKLEGALGKKANIIFEEMQPGDVFKTYADTSKLTERTGFQAKTSFDQGIENFVKWYKEFYS
tara:strand:+ start:892 stop:1863 length:972 start_codon:yes stop_codon:yes gene_type:complete